MKTIYDFGQIVGTPIAHLQKYYGVYLLIIAMLFLILWFPNRAVNRYAISTDISDNEVWIVDTRTGHTWWRDRARIMDLGTTNKPKFGESKLVRPVDPNKHN
ncbi:MAG: hypothetical protein MUO33_07865 [Sedimentisphaerales bacterium]|nr:hypothetical protein [Sedimentisphaerales bacterium]